MTNDLRLHDNLCWDFFVKEPGDKAVIFVLSKEFIEENNERFNKRASDIFTNARLQLSAVIKKLGYKVLVKNNYSVIKGNNLVISEDTSPFARSRFLMLSGIVSKIITFDTKHLWRAPAKKYKVFSKYYDFVLSDGLRPGDNWKILRRKSGSQEPANIRLYLDALESLKGYNPEVYNRSQKASVKYRSGSTGVSWALARGIVSPREVYDYCRKIAHDSSESFSPMARELIFRDFYSRASLWFRDLDITKRFRNTDIHWKINKFSDYIKKIHDPKEPKIILEIYNQLIRTGNLSNYGRMLFATWTYDISADWKLGELLFSRELLDYDSSSNYWNWAHHSIQGLNFQWPGKKFKISDDILYV